MKTPTSLKIKIKRFWKMIGPGLVTGASDDDPSGIATYSQAGAAFGLATLWTSIVAFPLMAVIQQMCARIGLVTSQGLTGTLKKTLLTSTIIRDASIQFPCNCNEHRCRHCWNGCGWKHAVPFNRLTVF